MSKKITIISLVFLLAWPVISLASTSREESLGQKIGQFGHDLREDVEKGFQETKKASQEALNETKRAGKQASQEVKDGSRSFWGKTKQRLKTFWHDVKKGFSEDD